MITLISILDSFIFSGLTDNIIWSLIKKAWEKASEKSWNELYLDSFISAFEMMRPTFSKYANGEIKLDKEHLQKTLSRNLKDIDSQGLSDLTGEAFIKTVAKVFSEKKIIVLGGNNLNQEDYDQLTYNIVNCAKSIFRRTILENENAFRQAVLSESKQNLDYVQELSKYLHNQFDITLVRLDSIEKKIVSHKTILDRIGFDISEIKQKLEIDRPEQELLEEIKINLETIQLSPMFEIGGLCSGYPLIPRPNQYFIAQEFNSEQDDLRQALSKAIEELGLVSVRADDFYWGGPILCKISALILSTRFGVYQLTKSQNRNVYLELGMAFGQRKPFILVKDRDAVVTSLVQGLEYFPINGYLDLRFNLIERANPLLAEIGRYKPYELPIAGSQRKIIIAHGGGWDVVDFSVMVANLVQDYKLKPVLLNDPGGNISYYLNKMNIAHETIGTEGGNRLDETANAIQSACLGIYRIDKESEADTFVSLGISIALNRPALLVYKTDPPSDLQGLNALKFSNEREFTYSFLQQFSPILNRYCQ